MAHVTHRLDGAAWVSVIGAAATAALASITAGTVRAKVGTQPAATDYAGHLFRTGQAITREHFPSGEVWVRGRAVVDAETA